MSRHFGIMDARASLGGIEHPPARHSARNTGADLILFPAGLSIGPPLERPKILQALIDVVAMVSLILFLCSVACSLPVAIFLMFFASF